MKGHRGVIDKEGDCGVHVLFGAILPTLSFISSNLPGEIRLYRTSILQL